MQRTTVTTSWDDGHTLDIRLAELLKKYNLRGTFYISPHDHQIKADQRLTSEQLKMLAGDFEIGAHTMTHPLLSAIDDVTARAEMAESKTYLENALQKPVTSFCYPSGDYKPRHEAMVKEEGFSLARTVKRFAFSVGTNPFALPTTIHAYRHWSDVLPILRLGGLKHFIRYYLNWDAFAIALFEKTRKEGGVFHLWGHSWEIDANGDWQRLERVFKYISGHAGVQYVANNQLV